MFKIRRKTFTTILALLIVIGFYTKAIAKEGVMHRFARAVFAIPKAILNSMSGPSPCEPTCDSENINIHFPYFYTPTRGYGQTLYYITPPYSPTNQAPNYVTYQVIIPKKDPNLKDKANVHIYSSIPFENR